MIKELIYVLIIILGIPFGLLLSKICKEEIKNWRKRLKILIAGCFVIIVALFFLDFEYKISSIIALFCMILTFSTVLLKR